MLEMIFMYEHPARFSGYTTFTMTKKIADPSYLLFYVYEVLKAFNFHFTSVVSEFLIHRLIILDLMLSWEMIKCLAGTSADDP